MKGTILDFSFQTSSGTISGDDGSRYSFTGAQWQASDFPETGMRVDFDTDGDTAVGIYIDTAPPPASPRPHVGARPETPAAARATVATGGDARGRDAASGRDATSGTAPAMAAVSAATATASAWLPVAKARLAQYAAVAWQFLKGVPRKWLIAGGAVAGVAALAVIALVVLLATEIIGGGNPQPVSALDLTPDDAITVVHLDVQKISEADDLADDLEIDDVVDLDDVGILPGEVTEIVISDDQDGGAITVLKGDFNLDDLREEWEDDGAEKDAYRGYEIWTNMSNGGIVAPLNNYLLMSESERPVEKALKNLYNSAGSLEQADGDNAMKQVLDRLGRGYAAYAAGSRLCQVNGCEAYGYVIADYEAEDEEAEIEIALLFHNERTAERAADDYDDVADFLELSDNLDIEDTEANGKFVTGVAYREIE